MEKKGIIIGSTGSGTGKTTVTVAIVSALRKRGIRVVAFKCGPDYLDPTYLERASGRRCENLDVWMMGREGLMEVFSTAVEDAEFAVVEGVMGLFDGVAGTSTGSTAELAELLGLPVLLVIDASGMSATAGAIFHGMREFNRRINLKALICNRTGSDTHRRMLKEAVGRGFFCGALPRLEEPLVFKSRHLGLLRADNTLLEESTINSLAEIAERYIDIDRVIELAVSLPAETLERRPRGSPAHRSVRIAVALDEAFNFYYPYNLGLLKELGAELVEFSPLKDDHIPPGVDGIYLGGGYPECFAERLSTNRSMLESVRKLALSGIPVYAECGGLIYLTEGVTLTDGRFFPMAGLLQAECVMHTTLRALGYVEVETTEDSILGHKGTRMRGHQFRYSELVPRGRLERIYRLRSVRTGELVEEGYRVKNVVASYVHTHWACNRDVPLSFIDACKKYRRSKLCQG